MAARATPGRRWIRSLAGVVIALVGVVGTAAGQPAGTAKSAPVPDPAPVERQVVGVIDLRGTVNSAELATDVAEAIADKPVLVQIADSRIAAALISQAADEDGQAIETARDRLRKVESHMADVALADAVRVATEGFDALLVVSPNRTTIELQADLAFAAGQALFAQRTAEKKTAAQIQFELVHRLSPGRTLDPTVYIDELVDAFAKAAKPRAGTATLEIQAEGTIWLDGREQPAGTTTIAVAPGRHVISSTGPENLPSGVWRDVSDGQRSIVQLPRRTAPAGVLVARARKELATATDPAAKAVAMAKIQRLTGIDAAVIITNDSAGAIGIQLWREREGFAAIKSAQQPWTAEAEKAIAPLLPPEPVVEPDPILPPIGPREPEKPWYRKRWVQVGLVAGVIGVIAGSIAIANAAGASMRDVNPPMPAPMSRE